ncbi:MAG: putative phosphoesterase [Desulforhopalus sp.]|jgi:putative phosphoesterase
MSTKIGLIGDVHATVSPIQDALKIFEQESVDLVLCVGDIAGYGTELEQSVKLLIETGCITILGNHDAWHINRNSRREENWVEAFFNNLPITWDSIIEGKRFFAVHASPPVSMNQGITLLDQYETIMPDKREQWGRELEKYSFDVLVVGHTHQVFAELLGQTLVINPGSTKFNNSCAILSLPDLEVKTFPLLGQTIRKVWHWGIPECRK